MTALEKMRTWIATFPDYDILSNGFHVDYTDKAPANGGIFPSGLVEVERRKDIMGQVTVTNQYNFGIYCVFTKAPGDDSGAIDNADWVMGFQEWDRVLRSYYHYIERGTITLHGLENVDRMYKEYHNLGGNGTVTKLVEDLRKLPVVDN